MLTFHLGSKIFAIIA